MTRPLPWCMTREEYDRTGGESIPDALCEPTRELQGAIDAVESELRALTGHADLAAAVRSSKKGARALGKRRSELIRLHRRAVQALEERYTHRGCIERALARGETVPEAILAEYPDMENRR